MTVLLIILGTTFLLLFADLIRWKILVRRELKRRDLVRARAFSGFVHPAIGYRMIEACVCNRDGKEYLVLVMNRGWFRTELSFCIDEI